MSQLCARTLLACVTALVCLHSPRSARAQSGGLFLQMDTQLERTRQPEKLKGLRDVHSAGMAVDAYGGSAHIGFAAYLNVHFGGGYQGGFAYRVSLLPVGVALYDRSQTIGLAFATGLQLQGVTGHQVIGVQQPLRADLRVRLGTHLLLDMWASSDVALGTRRDQGSRNAPVGDELQAGASLRIGRGGDRDEGRHSLRYGSGYFVGVLYAERFANEFWGLAIGHGMDMHGS